MIPGIEDLISHTLCYEELTYLEDDCNVYKDLSLLAHNRVINFTSENEADHIISEIMVIDTHKGEECCD